MPREYRRLGREWAARFIAKHLPEVRDWSWQVPIFDTRGINPGDLKSFGPTLYERIMPRADVIAVTETELIIVQMSGLAATRAIEDLTFYIDAIRHDTVRLAWKKLKIRPIFVSDHHDGRQEAICKERGYEYYVLPWPGETLR